MSDSYNSLTVGDPNPIKRRLHTRRFRQAVKRIGFVDERPTVLDFGAGDGELAHHIISRYPDAQVTLYEPSTVLMAEAKDNLAKHGRQVKFAATLEEIDRKFPYIFCLSVFEHLPARSQRDVLLQLAQLALPSSKVLVEVPSEQYVAALAKGIFRYRRRPDDFDGQLNNIWQAVIGSPPTDRPLGEIAPGLPWHRHHLGFNHSELEDTISSIGVFSVDKRRFSPVNTLGAIASLDIYYTLSPKPNASD